MVLFARNLFKLCVEYLWIDIIAGIPRAMILKVFPSKTCLFGMFQKVSTVFNIYLLGQWLTF